jgi:hypothetical protein
VKRLLFDHCVPRPLRRLLPGYFVRTCHEEGWDSLRNGELLKVAELAQFDVFVTADQSLRYQQDLRARQIAVIELPTNRLALLPAIVPALEQAIGAATRGSYARVALP